MSPGTKHKWHCTIGFLILFFHKEYAFFSNVFISFEYDIRMLFVFGWEIGHLLSTCATEGMEGVIKNVYRCIQGESGITPHVYLRIYRQLLFSCFILRCLVLTFIKRGCFCQKWLFFSNKINFCCREISFFISNCFSESKLTTTLLILIK